jgi:anti-sigma regulatory factor (Ser/Thr protein kinase)/CBS domain-containing protein
METRNLIKQELLFELKVADVMRTDVIMASPDQCMGDLHALLRDHQISGTPVVDQGRLVGVISIEDLIGWLNSGGADATIRDHMSLSPQCLQPDMLLVHAIGQFEKSGFGRYPVVEPGSDLLLGILTKGLIIEGMLQRLAKELQDEEIRRYRASHFFQDIVAEYKEIYLTYEIVGKDFDKAGSGSTQIKKNLKRLGIRPDIIHRLAIASYEAEINSVIYSDGGVMAFRVTPDEICMKVKDRGPGIEDVELAMQPGWSGAADWVREMGFGAGMGIPNIRRNADKFELESIPGVGTTLSIRIFTGEDGMSHEAD